MSAFSDKLADKIAKQKEAGFFKVADFDVIKEQTYTIAYLAEDVEKFEKTMDILYFKDTQRYLQLNTTNAEILIDLLGDEPHGWTGRQVTLYLYEYKIGKYSIRIKAPGSAGNSRAVMASTPAPDFDDSIPFN